MDLHNNAIATKELRWNAISGDQKCLTIYSSKLDMRNVLVRNYFYSIGDCVL